LAGATPVKGSIRHKAGEEWALRASADLPNGLADSRSLNAGCGLPSGLGDFTSNHCIQLY
jgi:hypothetical protein